MQKAEQILEYIREKYQFPIGVKDFKFNDEDSIEEFQLQLNPFVQLNTPYFKGYQLKRNDEKSWLSIHIVLSRINGPILIEDIMTNFLDEEEFALADLNEALNSNNLQYEESYSEGNTEYFLVRANNPNIFIELTIKTD